MIRKESGEPRGRRGQSTDAARSLKALFRRALQRVWVRYAFAVAVVAAAFGLRMLLESVTGTGAPFVLFFGVAAITSLSAGPGPGICATLLSAPFAAYAFVVRAGHPPSQAAFQAALFAVDGLIVVYLSFLMTRARRAAESTGERLRLANEAAEIVSWDLDVPTEQLRLFPTSNLFPKLVESQPASLTVWRNLVHPDDREAFARAHRRSLDPAGDGALYIESRVLRPDGVVRWFSWQGRTHYQQRRGGRLPVRQVGTAIDITERRQREAALQELTAEVSRSEARRRDLLELAPDGFFVAELDGRFTDVNQAACRMLGYAREELIGKTILDLIPPEDAPRLAAVKAALLVPGEVNRAEWIQRRKDGSSVPVEVSSNILPDGRWQAFARDITERKRMEDALKASATQFRTLAEAVPQIVWITRPDGWNTYFNQQWVAYTGLSLEESYGHGWNKPFHPDDRQRAWDAWQKAVRTDGVYSLECRLRRADGTYRWWLIRGVSLHDESGKVVSWFGTCTDVDDIKRTEEALRRARDETDSVNQQLRESEERFRLTIDEAPIGMALVSLDGRFARVNAALCEIVGYSAEELERLRFQEITHPEDLDSDLELVGRLAAGEIPRYQLEKRYIRKDGGVAATMLNAAILRAPDGAPRYVIAQMEDISERKRAEEARRFSEARFSGIISIAADAIISIDQEQRIVLFNDGAEKIFGYPRSEAVGAPLDLLLPESLRALHHQHVATFAAGEVTARPMAERQATILGRRKNGEEFPAEAAISKLQLDGQTIVTVALRDVTERKRVEKAQRFLAEAGAALSSSLDYEQTLSTVGELVVRDFADWCVVDIVERDGRPKRLKVVGADPRAAALAERIERMSLDLRRTHLVGTVLETRRPVLIERMTAGELESRALDAEHLQLLRAIDPRSAMGLPLMSHGQVLGVLVFISSTPSRVYGPGDLRLAEALAERAGLAIENGRLYQTALHATQLRDEVLGVVAHDLRNPLSAIQMQAAALERKGPEPERRKGRPREVILRAANRMNRLIGDLLDVSLIEAGQLGIASGRLSARQLVADSLETQQPLASAAALEIGLDLTSELPDIWGDQTRLLQVLENLVGNAIKFTPGGGRITLGAAARAGEVLFWVADTGRGMSPDELPHVFDRFWQAKKGSRMGAGLGLPITRGIVEAHGGRIWVESVPGRGSIFFFTIPEAISAERSRPDVAHSPN